MAAPAPCMGSIILSKRGRLGVQHRKAWQMRETLIKIQIQLSLQLCAEQPALSWRDFPLFSEQEHEESARCEGGQWTHCLSEAQFNLIFVGLSDLLLQVWWPLEKLFILSFQVLSNAVLRRPSHFVA